MQKQGDIVVASACVGSLQQLGRGGSQAVQEDVPTDQRFGVIVAVKLHVQLAQRPVEVNGRAGGQARTYERGDRVERLAPVPEVERGEECPQAHALDRLSCRIGREKRARLDEHREAASKHLHAGHGGSRRFVLVGDSRFPVREVDG